MATVTRRLAALLGASGAGLTDSATASQITTTSLKDDAVTSAKIGTDQVGADALSSSAIAGAADIPANSVGESELSIDLSAQSVPHIIPGVLYPSYVASGTSNKLLDGTTNHSGAFGTEQSDGRKYYYTNIKGSKPIKDPRIGAHFGSQRHKFKSLQLLEQETATHGNDVFSIDGREWCRAVGSGGAVVIKNDDDGQYIQTQGTAGTIEITGYFNAVNLLAATWMTSTNTVLVAINGVTAHSAFALNGTAETPLGGTRYVDQSSVYNIDITSSSSLSADTSLGINTIKIKHVTGDSKLHGIELIAQDLSGSGSPNRSKIKFPAQNVVSFGKKFEISETNHHYDPFTTMSYGGSGTTASALGNLIDTATSLGMDNWKAGGDNFHRPWNGGRVVKWVDSTGTIKTSVTMMPPNAQNISATTSNAITNTEVTAGTNTETINFDDTTIANASQLHEVATSLYAREFGNGSANDNGNYADISTVTGDDDVAFVLDDGLTNMSGSLAQDTYQSVKPHSTNSPHNVTFIGTGLTLRQAGNTHSGIHTIAQNLPFGTHVLSAIRNSTATNTPYKLDGVQLFTGFLDIAEVTIHQPKKPPIPEDCVVLADYMLMADFVPQPTAGVEHIPKGVRYQAQSRDYKIDKTAGTFGPASGTFSSANSQFRTGQYFWWKTSNSSGDTYTQELPFFGDSFVCHFTTQSDSDYAAPVVTLNGSALSGFTNTGNGSGFTSVTAAGVVTETGNAGDDNVVNFKAGAGTLGANTLKVSITSNAATKYMYNRSFSVATPIHTSSHYQAFETPILHELVGGDRNMEQTNLVCSPDGKTWDEVTRDTSYIGNLSFMAARTSVMNHSSNVLYHEVFRGNHNTYRHYHNKDFAIARNNLYICLRTGVYTLNRTLRHNGYSGGWKVNENYVVDADCADEDTTIAQVTVPLQRGDYVYVTGGNAANNTNSNFTFILRAD